MNIYKYTFYLFYKFGIKIKTPDPAFAAVCIVTSVEIIQVIILFGFLHSLEAHPVFNLFFDDSLIGKLVALVIAYLILLINIRHIFKLKKRSYLKIIEQYESSTKQKKYTRTLITLFFILIIPILCLFILWNI